METTGHMTIIFFFKPTYRPDLQAISARATEDQIGMALEEFRYIAVFNKYFWYLFLSQLLTCVAFFSSTLP